MSVTWGDLKKLAEDNGVTDDMQVDIIVNGDDDIRRLAVTTNGGTLFEVF